MAEVTAVPTPAAPATASTAVPAATQTPTPTPTPAAAAAATAAAQAPAQPATTVEPVVVVAEPAEKPAVFLPPCAEDEVLMVFPHPVTLTVRYALAINFKAGIQPVKKQYADHPYLKANGVTLYEG